MLSRIGNNAKNVTAPNQKKEMKRACGVLIEINNNINKC